jgi:hypothetical protein
MKHEEALALSRPGSKTRAHFKGKWVNELNSIMTLHLKGSSVTGRYKSFVSSTGKTVSGPISGYVNGNAIAFVVTWPTGSITAWVGQLVREKRRESLETLWQLTSQVPDPGNPKELWNSVNSGADRFRRLRSRKPRT